MRQNWFVLVVAVAAAALLLTSGLGVRLGLWPYPTGFLLLRVAFFGGLAAAGLAGAALLIPKARARSVGGLVAALVIGTGTAYLPWHLLQAARSFPPIHDITTDLENPPAFLAVLALRADAPNPAAYGGPEVAALQREAYPDIRPLTLAEPPAMAFARSLEAAQNMGWKMVAVDRVAGRIEATATTFWFGFKDDVVIRIAPSGLGSRIDVRSVSRVGRGDAGTNAKRVRAFFATLGG